MKKRYVFLICLLGCLWGACGDFLTEESHELMYARDCKDMEELLIGNGYMKADLVFNAAGFDMKLPKSYYSWLHVMDDDVQAAIAGQELIKGVFTNKMRAFYCWEASPFNIKGDAFEDKNWATLYEHIAVLNVILNKVEEFTHDKEEDRNSVRGQCHFLRAAYYYLLVNLYAKPYDPVTASSDLGVPLKLSPIVEDKNFTRTPVDSVYNQIVHDLQMAVDYLEGIEMPSVNRANQDAARLLLSRVYCYMGKWDLVPELCREILKGKYSLMNMKSSGQATWLYNGCPEIIFTQGQSFGAGVFYQENHADMVDAIAISPDLLEVFSEEDGDVRKNLVCREHKYGGFLLPAKLTGKDTATLNSMKTYISDCFLLRLPEVHLNLAEALAMTDQDGEARVVLADLMKTRIPNLRTLTESGEALVKLIRKERRRELCFECQRWFDLRRYAVSPKYPEALSIRHGMFEHNAGDAEDKGTYIGYYELPAYPDGAWVMPIPTYEIEQTEGAIIQNERVNCIFKEE